MYWGKAGPQAQTSNGMVPGHISLRFLSPVWQDILIITLRGVLAQVDPGGVAGFFLKRLYHGNMFLQRCCGFHHGAPASLRRHCW